MRSRSGEYVPSLRHEEPVRIVGGALRAAFDGASGEPPREIDQLLEQLSVIDSSIARQRPR